MTWVENVGDISRVSYNDWLWKVPETYVSHNQECITSPTFSFGGETWKLVIIPSDGSGAYVGKDCSGYAGMSLHGGSGMNWLSLFLWNTSSPTKGQEYSVELGLRDIKGGTFVSHKGSTTSDYGFGKWDLCNMRRSRESFCLYGLMKIFLVMRKKNESNPNDGLVSNEETYDMEIENEVFAMAKDGKFEKFEDKGIGRLVRDFKNLLDEKQTSDVVIKTSDREFYAHRMILLARSPMFASMFRHEMSEKTSGIVDIPDCTAEAFEVFLRYLYTGNADTISPDNVMNLYYTADKYRVDDLKAECAEFIKRTLTLDNICSVISLSIRHNDSGLLNAAKKYFCKNVKKIIKTVQWEEFRNEYPVHANEVYEFALNNVIYD